MILETYTRIFVKADALERTIAAYVKPLSGDVSPRFASPEAGLELAAVSSPRLSVLIVAGLPQLRAPFEATRPTVRVDRLEEHLEPLRSAGAGQLEPVRATPVGRKTRFRPRTA
ncbi:MAG: hypothetical protein H0S85_02050 [Desulfovibrionaceae bacterium]|jgi:hypothetical protein|nr:hypothetical protein [Desulfovibrionaceae bacterium]